MRLQRRPSGSIVRPDAWGGDNDLAIQPRHSQDGVALGLAGSAYVVLSGADRMASLLAGWILVAHQGALDRARWTGRAGQGAVDRARSTGRGRPCSLQESLKRSLLRQLSQLPEQGLVVRQLLEAGVIGRFAEADGSGLPLAGGPHVVGAGDAKAPCRHA